MTRNLNKMDEKCLYTILKTAINMLHLYYFLFVYFFIENSPPNVSKVHFNTVLFQNNTRNLFPNKTNNISLLPLWTVSARQGPVLGPVQSIQARPGTSLCSCPGLSLPDRPHSMVS